MIRTCCEALVDVHFAHADPLSGVFSQVSIPVDQRRPTVPRQVVAPSLTIMFDVDNPWVYGGADAVVGADDQGLQEWVSAGCSLEQSGCLQLS